MMFINNKKHMYVSKKQLLSQTELAFYSILRKVIQDDTMICPKVAINEIFMEIFEEKKGNCKNINKITMKPIDFLICSSNNLIPIFGIELEEESYNRMNRIERDRILNTLFNEANLPLLRFKEKEKYEIQEIKEKLDLIFVQSERSIDCVAATIETDSLIKMDKNQSNIKRNKNVKLLCPVCGAEMILRKTRRGHNKGKEFYLCSNYPKCKEVLKRTYKLSVL